MRETFKATNPAQYDSPDLDWSVAGSEEKQSRVYFREQLDSVISNEHFLHKRVLDIGSGVGQLFNWFKNKGATEIVGIDPSERNVRVSNERYPWVKTYKYTLSEFVRQNKDPFDAAVSVMVFEHIKNLNEAFTNVASSLKEGGEFYLIIGDKDYGLTSDIAKRGAKVVGVEVIQSVSDGTVETKTTRAGDGGEITVMYDLFRPIEYVRQAAQEAGFNLFVEKELMGPFALPPEERNFCICHLLGFRKG